MHMSFLIFIFFTYIYGSIFEGNTLFTPVNSNEDTISTILMNNEFEYIHTWHHNNGPASMPYLLPDSTLIYPYRVPFPTMDAGGVGGGIQALNWNNDVLWDYTFSNEIYQHHHDIEPMPNGNILIIVWEMKTAEQAYALGRQIINNDINQVWSSAILEIETNNGDIVWEWHLWDHFIQDVDPNLPSYGVISEHPELFDINCGEIGSNTGGPMQANGDWLHLNSVHYNSDLDQIIISSRAQNEIYIIDHSTSTEEAASHTGGNSGKGGDFLYRWGNPANYNRGTNTNNILNSQHSVNWINNGYPGEGNIIIFNNFHNDASSSVIEIIPPLNDVGTYDINHGLPYGPETWQWIYSGNITTPMQGGAFRLPNGNTIITQTHTSKIIEVSYDGELLWEYIHESQSGISWIARAQKYEIDYLFNPTTDLNNDGITNILDIIFLSNIILESNTNNPQLDLNNDGYYDILDIITLITYIL